LERIITIGKNPRKKCITANVLVKYYAFVIYAMTKLNLQEPKSKLETNNTFFF